MKLKLTLAGLAIAAVATGCASNEEEYTPLSFTPDGDRLILNGEIDSDTINRFIDATDANPQAKTLVLQNIGGSLDDDANLELSRLIREMGFATLVPSDGLVASGGTDLFLSGVSRTLEPGACVGVHSWGSEDGTEGVNVPENDPVHSGYLDYYRDMGIPGEFYWFTLNAAPAEGMLWITAEQASQYNMTDTPATLLGDKAQCDAR